MAYLIFILVSLLLLFGFLWLTRIESHRGTRVFAKQRTKIDDEVARTTFIVTHVDFPQFVRGTVELTIARIAHDLAHAGLLFVRFLERLLTRAVRALRARRILSTPPEPGGAPSSEFVSAMKDFKEELKSGRGSSVG